MFDVECVISSIFPFSVCEVIMQRADLVGFSICQPGSLNCC